MPRTYVPKGVLQLDRTNLEKAFNYRVETGCSLREVAAKFDVKMRTLQDAFGRSNKKSDGKTFVPMMEKVNRVFSTEQENRIEDYTKNIACMFYGLPIVEFLKLVYTYAIAVGSAKIPEAWQKEKAATRDWYYAFMKRHPNLTLKTPEGISIARITAFNRTNVDLFFKVYSEAMESYSFTPDRIFNLDESSLTTVMKPVKVICQKGIPVASQISRERGTSVTFVGIINAAGSFIPPVFVIPRKRWNDSFMRRTIDGSIGLLHQNGWMNGELFLETLKHIQKKTYCSPANKILLIMDNAECHMNIHAVEFAIENGIVIVTLPPHTTAKLQPLYVSIFGPFESHMRYLSKDFHLANPDKLLTEHQLPELASKAWIKACTPSNILSGFAATGIWPINRNIFSDEAFAGAEVTKKPTPQEIKEGEQNLDLELHATSPTPLSRSSTSMPTTPAASNITTPGTLDIDAPVPSGIVTPGPSGYVYPSLSGTATPGPSGTATPGPSILRSVSITPGSSCSDLSPKAAARPLGKGRKRVKTCILIENSQAIQDLKAKEEKKKAGDKKKKVEKKKSQTTSKAKRRKVTNSVELGDEGSDIDGALPGVLDDSSDYSDEVEEAALEADSSYPFKEKGPEVDRNQNYAGRLVRAESSSNTLIPPISQKRKHNHVDFHMQDDDECDGFGKFVAGKLKKMSRIQRESAGIQILELLCNRSMHTSSTSFSISNVNECDNGMEGSSLSPVKSESDELWIKTEEEDMHEGYYKTEDDDPC